MNTEIPHDFFILLLANVISKKYFNAQVQSMKQTFEAAVASSHIFSTGANFSFRMISKLNKIYSWYSLNTIAIIIS